MSKSSQALKVKKHYSLYHTPGCPYYVKRPKNAVFISPANSLEHEVAKLKVCYELRQNKCNFITEAVRNHKDENGKERRVDIVNLNTGDEIEIETDPKRAVRFEKEKGVVVVKLWENG